MVFEYVFAIEEYITVLLDVNMLFYNFMHAAGRLYDLGEEVYFRIVDWENQLDTLAFWIRMGQIVGLNFHYLFKYPDNYDVVEDPETYNQEEREENVADEDWDDW